MKVIENLYFFLKAARFWKNIPLVLTFLSGFFINFKNVQFNIGILLVAFIAILISSFFMTHINVITDYELDKDSKPEFFNFLNINYKFSIKLIWLELVIVLVLLCFLIIKSYYFTALSIFIFIAIATLYSYNFLLGFSVFSLKYRLKVFWWGHFVVLIIGYMSLWFAGFYLFGSSLDNQFWLWFISFLLFSISEYSLFLIESSIDVKEEIKLNLKSLNAILGTKKTNIIAILLNVISIFGIVLIVNVYNFQSQILYFAILPMMIVRLCFELFMLNKNNMQLRHKYLRTIPDILFNFTRLYILIVIIIVNFLL